MSLRDLLKRDHEMGVYCKHIDTLLTEICKHFQKKILIYEKSLHEKRYKRKLNVRTSKSLSLRNINIQIFSLNTFSFHNSHLWNYLPDQVNIETSVKAFKIKLARNHVLLCKCNPQFLKFISIKRFMLIQLLQTFPSQKK